MSTLYQCPYNKAVKCNLELPCKGCEDFSKAVKNDSRLKVRINVAQFAFDALEAILSNKDVSKLHLDPKLQLVGFEPEPEIKIIPNNPENGEVREFVDAKLCAKCSPDSWLERLFLAGSKTPDVLVCCVCGHEQKILRTKIK